MSHAYHMTFSTCHMTSPTCHMHITWPPPTCHMYVTWPSNLHLLAPPYCRTNPNEAQRQTFPSTTFVLLSNAYQNHQLHEGEHSSGRNNGQSLVNSVHFLKMPAHNSTWAVSVRVQMTNQKVVVQHLNIKPYFDLWYRDVFAARQSVERTCATACILLLLWQQQMRGR